MAADSQNPSSPATGLAALLHAGVQAATARACVLYRERPGPVECELLPVVAAGEEAAALKAAVLKLPAGDVDIGAAGTAAFVPGDHPLWKDQAEAARKLARPTGGAVFCALPVEGALRLVVGFLGSSRGEALRTSQALATAQILGAALAKEKTTAGESESAIRKELERRDAQAKAQVEFLAGLGHELKTPLNAIIGFASLLERQILDEELHEEVEMISLSAEKLLTLIDDLIDSYRIQAGKLVLHKDLCSINEVIANSAEQARVIADARGIHVRTYLDNSLPGFHFDSKRIQQVMVNLLGNAVKFVPSGGEIIVRSTRDAGQARVQVADTGEGIPTEVLPYIFERFKQAEGAELRDTRSAGLGLALCKDFVEMHGGTITVTSERQKGSIFTFTLPMDGA